MKPIEIRYGIIAGVATIAYLLLFYIIDRLLFLDWRVYWSSMLFYLWAMYKACIAIRSKNAEEVLRFQEALRAAFKVFLVANVLFYVFYYVLFNWVDPQLVDLQKQLAVEMYKKILPPEQAREMIKTMSEKGFDLKLGSIVWEYAKGAIAGFGFALIIAAITKQEDLA